MTAVALEETRRRYRLYTIRAHRPWWWWRGRRLYIGYTGRWPIARWAEHLADKPWASEIGSISASWRCWRTQEAAERAETRAIHRHQPPKNIAHRNCRCR